MASVVVVGPFTPPTAVEIVDGKIVVPSRWGNLEYKVGGEAVYDRYNLAYIGKIVSITSKTVTIEEPYSNPRRHRLNLAKFVHYNDIPLEKSKKRNGEWMD